MTDTCGSKSSKFICNKICINKKLIGPATSKSQYLIWIMNHYYLTSGHCIWEAIIERRSWLEMSVSKVTDSNLTSSSHSSIRCLECIKQALTMGEEVLKLQEAQKIGNIHLKKFKICTRKIWTIQGQVMNLGLMVEVEENQ